MRAAAVRAAALAAALAAAARAVAVGTALASAVAAYSGGEDGRARDRGSLRRLQRPSRRRGQPVGGRGCRRRHVTVPASLACSRLRGHTARGRPPSKPPPSAPPLHRHACVGRCRRACASGGGGWSGRVCGRVQREQRGKTTARWTVSRARAHLGYAPQDLGPSHLSPLSCRLRQDVAVSGASTEGREGGRAGRAHL